MEARGEGQNLAWRRNGDSMIRHKNCVGLFLRSHQVMVPCWEGKDEDQSDEHHCPVRTRCEESASDLA